MKYFSLFLITLVIVISSCGKKDNTDNDIAPTDLVIIATVSNDSSGNVSFTATATNAVSYFFDFGNGAFQTVESGIVTYKYPASGTYTVLVIAKSASGQTVTSSIQVTVKVELRLLWSDEFDTPGSPDSAKWGFDLGDGCPNVCGWGNNELEWYTDRQENAIVGGGVLKIIAIRESFNGKSFTSARILSKNKFSFKYGKIEARAKLPAGVGTWAAIWMLGNNIDTVSWPACGEIDIMEYVGKDSNKIYGTLHHPGHSGANGDGSNVTISNATTKFHKYTVEWSEAIIKFSVDDTVFYTFTNAAGLPFNQDFFIILNIAMGGDFGGAVDPAFTNAAMEIDYIRVYQ